MIKLLTTDGGKHVVLEDLGIKAFCPASQASRTGERNFDYQIGDYVRVEVLEVDADSEKMTCGMRGSTMSAELQHTLHLGVISRHEFPRQFTYALHNHIIISASTIPFSIIMWRKLPIIFRFIVIS